MAGLIRFSGAGQTDALACGSDLFQEVTAEAGVSFGEAHGDHALLLVVHNQLRNVHRHIHQREPSRQRGDSLRMETGVDR